MNPETGTTPNYRLLYKPNGQIMFNDPRIGQALTDVTSDGALSVEQADASTYVACFFHGGQDLGEGIPGCDAYGIGRTPARAVRNVLGWVFGSQDLADHAEVTGRRFHASSHTDLILD